MSDEKKSYQKAANAVSLLGLNGMRRRFICGVCDRMIADDEEPQTIFDPVEGFVRVICPDCDSTAFWAKIGRFVAILPELKGMQLQAAISRTDMDTLYTCTLGWKAQYSRSIQAWMLWLMCQQKDVSHAWPVDQIREWNPDITIPDIFLKPVTSEAIQYLLEGTVPEEDLPPEIDTIPELISLDIDE